MSTVLEFALLLVGMFLGTWLFSVIILPLAYGFPRSLYWAVRRWVRWYTPLLYLVSPLIWTFAFLGFTVALIMFLPSVAAHLSESKFFAIGAIVGNVTSIGRPMFVRSARLALRDDFSDYIKRYLTPAGTAAFETITLDPHMADLTDIDRAT